MVHTYVAHIWEYPPGTLAGRDGETRTHKDGYSSMAFASHATINVLVLVFVACAAYEEATTFSVVSEDGGKTLKVIRVEESVSISHINYATAQLTGDIQQTG